MPKSTPTTPPLDREAKRRLAAIGIPGVLLSGALSYRAGRRQVRDQGANEHLQWLRQQRQERFVGLLQWIFA